MTHLNLALRRTGPRGLILLILALIWIGFGIGTVANYAGHPADAPHLRVDHTWRGIALWIIPGAATLALAIIATLHPADRLRLHRVALVLLSLGMLVRAASYTLSWVLSWDWLDAITPRGFLDGSRSAGYGSLPWWMGLLVVLMTAWAPSRWSDIYRYQRRERDATGGDCAD